MAWLEEIVDSSRDNLVAEPNVERLKPKALLYYISYTAPDTTRRPIQSTLDLCQPGHAATAKNVHVDILQGLVAGSRTKIEPAREETPSDAPGEDRRVLVQAQDQGARQR